MEKNAMDMAKTTSFGTERLDIRLMTRGEWAVFVDRVIKADEVKEIFAREPDEAFFKYAERTNFSDFINYSVFLSGSGEMIGYAGFCVDEGHPDNNTISYYIFNEYRRQGYACEAVRAFMDKILAGEIIERRPDEICAWVVRGNKPSSELLQKLGFQIGRYRILDNGVAEQCYHYICYTEKASEEKGIVTA